jgi:hypothetical protein
VSDGGSPGTDATTTDGATIMPEQDAPTCGHDCRGGACQAGACQPVVLVTAPFGVSSFAIDQASVYWTTDWTTNGDPTLASGTVSKCPLAGCTGNPTVLATRQNVAENLLLSGTTLYWLDYNAGSLMRCGIDCNDDAAIFYKLQYLTGEAFAANATQAFLAGPPGNVQECPTSLCIAPVTFASGQQTPSEIVVSGPGVYWINLVEAATGRKTLSFVDAGVLTCPASGCDDAGPTSLAGGMSPPTSLVVSGQSVYWAQGKSVVTCSSAGCNGTPTTIASLSAAFSGAAGIAIDANDVYFGATEVGGGTGPPAWQIMSCPLSGCPSGPTPLYSSPSESGGPVPQIFVDATRIYFVSGDGREILALAK